jgi:hypothetical protein
MLKILRPYHERRFHLDPGDFAQHVGLFHWIAPHPQLSSVILFMDEKSFTRDGKNNERNLHMWSHGNPHQTSQEFPKDVFSDRMVWYAC